MQHVSQHCFNLHFLITSMDEHFSQYLFTNSIFTYVNCVFLSSGSLFCVKLRIINTALQTKSRKWSVFKMITEDFQSLSIRIPQSVFRQPALFCLWGHDSNRKAPCGWKGMCLWSQWHCPGKKLRWCVRRPAFEFQLWYLLSVRSNFFWALAFSPAKWA